eukprot:gene18589-22242_t
MTVNMKKLILTLGCIFSLSAASAQNQLLFQEKFEHPAAYESAAGVKGMALNLTATAKKRKPIKTELLSMPASGSFTTVVWTKAAPIDDEAYILLSNKKEKTDSTQTVWELGKQATGAWYWSAMHGKSKYEYRPTLRRQPVNDGNWHQLAFTFNKEKKEVRLYYDGKNVAVYFTPELSDMLTKQTQLTIGGTASGDLSEWETYNGMVDELGVYNNSWDASQVMNSYFSVTGRPLKKESTRVPAQLKVMNYNIWHGGHETGKYVGPGRIAEVIKESGADVISMQETYGSGARIADELGYYFYLRSTNLSIMSRYPIGETITGIQSFYNGGAHINLGAGKKVLFITNWLNYPFDYWDDLEKNVAIDSASWMEQQKKENAGRLKQILEGVKGDIANDIPVIFCGDFNTGSHLDWTNATKHLNKGHIMPFPTGILMENAGFKDSFRVLYPDPLKNRGITWSPQFKQYFKDRIDYIYYKGNGLVPLASKVFDTHKIWYPSDHGAVMTTFRLK